MGSPCARLSGSGRAPGAPAGAAGNRRRRSRHVLRRVAVSSRLHRARAVPAHPGRRSPGAWPTELSEARHSFVFPCLHLAYGVGTIPVSAIFGVRDRLVDELRRGEIGAEGQLWVGAASHCHGLAARVRVEAAPGTRGSRDDFPRGGTRDSGRSQGLRSARQTPDPKIIAVKAIRAGRTCARTGHQCHAGGHECGAVQCRAESFMPSRTDAPIGPALWPRGSCPGMSSSVRGMTGNSM